MPDDSTANITEAATSTLRDTVKALEVEEKRLTEALGKVKDQRKAVAKALDTLTGSRRGPGRPRKTA